MPNDAPTWDQTEAIETPAEPIWEETTPDVDRETLARGVETQLGAAEAVTRMLRSPTLAAASEAGQRQIETQEDKERRESMALGGSPFGALAYLRPGAELAGGAAAYRQAAALPGKVAVELANAALTQFPRAEVAGRKPRFIVDARSGELRQQTPQEFIAEGRTFTPGQPVYQPRDFLHPSDMDKILEQATTPESLLTLPIGVSSTGAKVLLFSMVPGLAETVSDVVKGSGSEEDKRDRINSLVVPALLGLSTTRPKGMRLPELPSRIPPGPETLPESPVPPPLEFTGAALPGRPAGATPLRPTPGPEPLGPQPPRRGFPVEVPGTPAEARVDMVTAIRNANARTRGEIKRLFPKAEISGEDAAALRDLAFPEDAGERAIARANERRQDLIRRGLVQPTATEQAIAEFPRPAAPETPPGAPPAPETPPGPPPPPQPPPTPPAAPPAAPEAPAAPPTPPAAPTAAPKPTGVAAFMSPETLRNILTPHAPEAVDQILADLGSGKARVKNTNEGWKLGLSLRTPEQLARLKSIFDSSTDPFQKQYLREAYEAATGSGSAHRALQGIEGYKPPFPGGPPAPTAAETFAKESGWTVKTGQTGAAVAVPDVSKLTPEERAMYEEIQGQQGKQLEFTDRRKGSPTEGLTFYVPEGATLDQIRQAHQAKIAPPAAPAAPAAPEREWLGKPLSYWDNLTDPANLPKGDERARLAKSLGVPNMPGKIVQHIKRRVAEIRAKPEAPPAPPEPVRPAEAPPAAGAIADEYFGRSTFEKDQQTLVEANKSQAEENARTGVANAAKFGMHDLDFPKKVRLLSDEELGMRFAANTSAIRDVAGKEASQVHDAGWRWHNAVLYQELRRRGLLKGTIPALEKYLASEQPAAPAEAPPPVTPPAAALPAPAKPAEAPPTPAAPTPAPAAPAAAAPPTPAAKVQTEVTKTAQQAGTAEAKAAKAEIIRQTEEALAKAPDAYEVGPKAKTLTFDIPDDGTYKVLNTKQALSTFLAEAKRLATTPAPARPKAIPVSGASVTEEAEKAAQAYGSVEAAYRSVKRQREALPDNDPETPAKADAADRLLSALFDKTKAAELENKAEAAKNAAALNRAGQESFTKEIARIRALKRPTARHRQEIISLEERLAQNRARTKALDAEAEQLGRQAEAARAELEGPPPAAPSVGPGAASPAEFAERPDPEVMGINIGSPIWNKITRGWRNLIEGIRQLHSRSGQKQDIMMMANEAHNLPYMTGQQAGNSLRLRTKPEERTALTFLMQSLKMSGQGLGPEAQARLGQLEHAGDPIGYLRAKQTDLETAAQDFNRRGLKLEAQAAIEAAKAMRYARQNFNRLKPLADLAKRKFDLQLRREDSAGIHTDYENWYVPQRHELDLFTSGDRPIILGHSRAGGIGTNFKKAKVFEDYASAIEAGFVPRSLDIGDLLEHRVTQGERIIARKTFYDGMRTITDPVDGKPVVISIPKRKVTRPDGTVETQESVPLDYAAHEVIPGYRVAVHKGYDRLVNALTARSQLAESAAVGLLQDIAAVEKHIGLALDTFHASRTLQAEAAITGKLSLGARQRLGRALVEYNLADLDAAVAKGEITQEMADYIQTRQPMQIHGRTVNVSPSAVLRFGARNGLNVGRFADALYRQFLRDFPITGTVNKWVFDKMTRSAISHSFIAEFERVSKARPDLTAQQVARTVARDINVLFGNLQKESIFRNPSLRSIMQILFLAPQWVEALTRREARTVLQLGKLPIDVIRGRPVHLPTTAKAVGTGLAAYVVATQVANLITRGQLTFFNPEEGHKLDAWIPGGPRGFFISPLSVFGEITHDVIRYAQTKPDLATALQQIGANKLGNLGRFLDIAVLGRDPLSGEKIIGTARRAVRAAIAAVPVPITLSQGLRAGASAATGGAVPAPPPGAVQRQIMSSAGFKTEPVPSAQTRIYQLVDRWKMQAGPKYRAEVERRQKEDFGPSDYGPLRQALAAGRLNAARDAYRDLRNQGKTPRTIDQTISKPHPFTGSRVAEAAFMQTLTPEQREIYRQALEERKQLLQQFRQMQSTR